MADRVGATTLLGPIPSHFEKLLVALKAEVESSRVLSPWDDAPVDADGLLGPILDAILSAPSALGVQHNSIWRRQTLGGSLSIIWSELLEFDDEKVKGRYNVTDLPEAWDQLHARILAATESALRQLRDGGRTTDGGAVPR